VTELLETAIRLFAARGYQAVSLDDIGAELGLAGSSLYSPASWTWNSAASASASTRSRRSPVPT
jgi:Bacterial regulatory proteins, tetR family